MFEQIYFTVTIAGLLIATYTDLKERIVQNKLVAALALCGIALKIAESHLAASTAPLQTMAIGTIATLAASMVLYKLGVWASGDVKLAAAIAMLNPVNYSVLAKYAGFGVAAGNLPVFGISLIIYSALSVFPLGIAIMLSAALKHKEVAENVFAALKKKAFMIVEFAIVSGSAKAVLANFQTNYIFAIPIVLVYAFLPKNAKLGVFISAAIAGIALAKESFVIESAFISIPLLLFYAMIKIYGESREFAFKEKIKTTNLEEGMIPDIAYEKKNGRLVAVAHLDIKSVINHLTSNKIRQALHQMLPENVYVGPMQANGLTQEQADEIKSMAKKGLAPKEFAVKKTMPFVPAILIGYILLELTGDILWDILS